MPNAFPSKSRRRFSLGRILVASLAVYLVGYFVLMSRARPAVWNMGKGESCVAAFSSFRWASQWHGKPMHCFWNRVFEPLDKIYFSLFPSTVTMETTYHDE